MSYTLLRDEKRIARKKYRCDAYDAIINIMGINELEDLDKVKVKNFKGKIEPGDEYLYFVGITNGDFAVFRANTEMFDIYMKYKIYEE